jgi:transposase
MNLYCGIDLGNQSTALCIIDEEGKQVHEIEVKTDKQMILKALLGYGSLRCVVEATALAEWLCNVVERGGHQVQIIDPRQAKAITHSKKKTDRLDARKLAQICRTGWFTVVHRKSGKARGLRTYAIARKQLTKTHTAIKSTIRGLFRAHGLLLPKGDGKSFLVNVREALRDADDLLKRAVRPLLRVWQESYEQDEGMYRRLSKQIVRGDPTCKLLMTHPGVGPATAAVYVATIDDPRRFHSSAQVGSYLGMVPSEYQSGETHYKGRITKEGDRLLRWLLVEAATHLLCRSNERSALQDWGLRLQEQKGFGKARVAVARRMACTLHRMWLTGRPFEAYPH